MKILVAEDDLLNQFFFKSALTTHGWEMAIVANGALAVEECRGGHFDAILMDINMPVMDGVEAARQIRLFNTSIPIIAVTAYPDESMRNRCYEAGMNTFLEKPCTRKQITDAISAFFEEGVRITT